MVWNVPTGLSIVMISLRKNGGVCKRIEENMVIRVEIGTMTSETRIYMVICIRSITRTTIRERGVIR